jgi:TsgA-like MFS transporter
VLFLAIAALCYILGQLGFISWVPEYAKGLGMSLNDAGKLVSDFWMSYMFGMWAFSFILRFFDLAAYPDRTGRYCHRDDVPVQPRRTASGVVHSDAGLLLQRDLHPIITPSSQQTKVASPKLVNFVDLRHHRHHADLRGHRPHCGP